MIFDRFDRAFIKLRHNLIYQLLLLAIITLIAVVLRFYKLGEWSFWGDEYITVRRALTLLEAGLPQRTLSLLSTRAAINIWGVSEWSARFVAASAGALTVPALYFLIKRMFDPFVALLASLLLAISPWHIYWSQNARFYTVLLLFYSLALLLFYLGLEKDRPWYFVFSLVFLGLAIHERLFAAFFVPIAIGYVVLLKLLPFDKPPGLRLRNLVLFFAPGFVGALLLALTNPAVQDVARWERGFGFVNNNPLWIFAGVVFYMGVPLISMSAAGALSLLLKMNRAALLLALAAIIPLLSMMVISLFQYAANRYIFVSLTSVIILASVAVKELLWNVPKSAKVLAAGALLILVLAPMGDNMLYYRFQNGNRDDWKNAFALIATLKQEGEPVVTANRELADYYLREKTVGMQSIEISRFIADKERVWFVTDLTSPEKAPQTHRWILQNTQLVASLDVTVSARTFPMRIYLYDTNQNTLRAAQHP